MKNRKVIGADKIRSRKTRRLQVEVYATLAIRVGMDLDPEEDPGAEDADMDLPEEEVRQNQLGWAVSRQFETSTSREDFSDSLEWEELWEKKK